MNYNTAIGYQAGYSISTGSDNVAIGGSNFLWMTVEEIKRREFVEWLENWGKEKLEIKKNEI